MPMSLILGSRISNFQIWRQIFRQNNLRRQYYLSTLSALNFKRMFLKLSAIQAVSWIYQVNLSCHRALRHDTPALWALIILNDGIGCNASKCST